MKIITIALFLLTFGAHGQSLFEKEAFHQLEFAHRGGYHGVPENTIEVIVPSIRQHKLNAIEVDLILTGDRHLILFHDDTLGRVLQTNDSRNVSEFSADEICAIPFRLRGSEDVRVTRFEDLVDTLIHLAANEKEQFILELDFKTTDANRVDAVNELMRVVQSTEVDYGKAIYDYFFVSSFYPGTLELLRDTSDEIRLAFATNPFYQDHRFKARLAGLLMTHFAKKYDAEIVETNLCYLTKGRVNRWKKKYLVHSFTANSADERDHLKTLNVALTTNCPFLTECPHDPSDHFEPKRWCKRCVSGVISERKVLSD